MAMVPMVLRVGNCVSGPRVREIRGSCGYRYCRADWYLTLEWAFCLPRSFLDPYCHSASGYHALWRLWMFLSKV